MEVNGKYQEEIRRVYDVTTKYRTTWKETADFLEDVNMINLNSKWVNDETYEEILNKAMRITLEILQRN